MAYRQVIAGRYIDRTKLLHLLKSTFGNGENFSVRLQLNCWVLTIPRALTEDQIESCYLD